jgi:transposase
MDRDHLAAELARGRSIESIAREAGRHPSTVSYWVKRHGLTSAHAARHAARGGLAREELEPLVTAGLTIREMAAALDRSFATVRHWLRRYELTPLLAANRRGDRPLEVERRCDKHGVTLFRINGREGRYRCVACMRRRVIDRRRRVKEMLVAEAGGRCVLCGYDRYAGALQFHHVDPAAKRFSIAGHGARALDLLREEARRCVLLCGNCHAEVEAGWRELPRHSGVAQVIDDPG